MWRVCVSLFLVGTAVAELLSTLPFELTSALKQDFIARLDNDFADAKRSTSRSSLRRNAEVSPKYSRSGFVYMSLYAGSSAPDLTCKDPSSVYGEAVDSCFSRGTFSYKFQIQGDGCKGAVVEFYAGAQCQKYVGAKDITEVDGRCEESKTVFQFSKYLSYPAYQNFQCTTSAAPIIPEQPFKEPICEGLDDVYNSHKTPGPACTYSASVGYYTSHNCSTSTSIEFDFTATTCAGQQSQLTALCYRNPAEDDWAPVDDLYPAEFPPMEDDVVLYDDRDINDLQSFGGGRTGESNGDDGLLNAGSYSPDRQAEYLAQKFGVRGRESSSQAASGSESTEGSDSEGDDAGLAGLSFFAGAEYFAQKFGVRSRGLTTQGPSESESAEGADADRTDLSFFGRTEYLAQKYGFRGRVPATQTASGPGADVEAASEEGDADRMDLSYFGRAEYFAQKYGLLRKTRRLLSEELRGPSLQDALDQQLLEREDDDNSDPQAPEEGENTEPTYFLGFCTAQQKVSLTSELFNGASISFDPDQSGAGETRRLQWQGAWKVAPTPAVAPASAQLVIDVLLVGGLALLLSLTAAAAGVWGRRKDEIVPASVVTVV